MSQFVRKRCKATTVNQFSQEMRCNLPCLHVGDHVAVDGINGSRWEWKNEDDPRDQQDPHWKWDGGVATYIPHPKRRRKAS